MFVKFVWLIISCFLLKCLRHKRAGKTWHQNWKSRNTWTERARNILFNTVAERENFDCEYKILWGLFVTLVFIWSEKRTSQHNIKHKKHSQYNLGIYQKTYYHLKLFQDDSLYPPVRSQWLQLIKLKRLNLLQMSTAYTRNNIKRTGTLDAILM